LALLKAFAAIKDPAAREKVLKLTQRFASDAERNSHEFDEG
jgi:hypothetical protein